MGTDSLTLDFCVLLAGGFDFFFFFFSPWLITCSVTFLTEALTSDSKLVTKTTATTIYAFMAEFLGELSGERLEIKS